MVGFLRASFCLRRSEARVMLTRDAYTFRHAFVGGPARMLFLVRQVSVVMEQAIRLFHLCGVPAEDIDFINCDGSVMHGYLCNAGAKVGICRRNETRAACTIQCFLLHLKLARGGSTLHVDASLRYVVRT